MISFHLIGLQIIADHTGKCKPKKGCPKQHKSIQNAEAKQDAAGAFSGALSAAEEHLLHAFVKKHRENRNEHALYNIKRNDRKQDQR